MSEKQKQTGVEIAQIQEKQALSPEQQQRFEKEKQEILMLSQAQRNSLSSEVVSSYLKIHHDIDITKYSQEIQKKFVKEVQMLFAEFKNFDTSMIPKLKSIREGMSFGMESGKSDKYYRNMIIGNAIESRITVLKATIETQYGETIDIKGTKVNKTDYQTFESNTKKLDTQNGLKVFESILSKLRPGIQGGFNFTTLNIKDIIQQECKKNKKPYSQELFETYNQSFQEFVGKNTVFNARNGNGVISYKGKGFGLTSGGVNGLTNDRLKDIYKDKFEELDIGNMGMADLVIMMRVLFGVIPVAGDVVGGVDDGKQAFAGVNFDGSMHGLGENVFMYLISGLQLSIVGGTFAKLAKGPKLVKALETLSKIIEKLSKSPEMLKDIAKNEKVMKMLEAMSGMVKGIDNLLAKIKQTKTVGENANTSVVSDKDKFKAGKQVLKGKEIPDNLYKSHFSTQIPESLKSQNPMAWIDTSGEIHYNQTIIEQKFGVKITTENGKTLFDGKKLKDHKNAQEILDYLKELKAHEVTHRILEARGITEINVGERIYSQEDICSIVDRSRKLPKAELEALEKALKEKLGDDFRLLKNGELDADFIRRYDTKMVARGEDVRRESEAARAGIQGEYIQYLKNGILVYQNGGYEKNIFGRSILTAFFQEISAIHGYKISSIVLDNGNIKIIYGGNEIYLKSMQDFYNFFENIPNLYTISNTEMLKRLEMIRIIGVVGKESFDVISRIPTRLWELVSKKNVKILFTDAPLTNSLADKWVHNSPRGWEGENDFSKVGGVYDPNKRTVIVSMIDSRIEKTLLHEYGHALGDVLDLNIDGELINSHIRLYYKLDSYFQQGGPGGHAGVQEFIAESFADFMILSDTDFMYKYDKPLLDFYQKKMNDFLDNKETSGENILLSSLGFMFNFDKTTLGAGTIGSAALLGAGASGFQFYKNVSEEENEK